MNIFTWHFGLGFKPSSHIRLSLFFASQKSCFFACDKCWKKKNMTIFLLASNFCEILWSTKAAVGGFESKQQLRLFFLSQEFLSTISTTFQATWRFPLLHKYCLSWMTLEWHWGIKVQFSSLNFPLELFNLTQQKLNFDPTENCPSEPSNTSLKKTSNTWFQDGWAGGGEIQED